MDKSWIFATIEEWFAGIAEQFWRLVEGIARKEVREAVKPAYVFAVTAGGAGVNVTSGTTTTRQVSGWLEDGSPQTTETRRLFVLGYGEADPGAGQRWLVAIPNPGTLAPGVLLKRLS